MSEIANRADQLVRFLRQRDYRIVRELGRGACGETVLLHDDDIDEQLVCKKYAPYSESYRPELFANFLREVKLLHQVHHKNVVRVFNYYLYPKQYSGYILMEYVDGVTVDRFLSERPDQGNDIFLQAVDGFVYLEHVGILHRDIRPGNLLVRSDGVLKIIDLGFGKRIEGSEDFDKSIDLNWWCEPPREFDQSKYDFGTEVYFVGKLFEEIVRESKIKDFKYVDALRAMCAADPRDRLQRFSEVDQIVRSEQFYDVPFSAGERRVYRKFAEALSAQLVKMENATKYVTDVAKIEGQLNDVYQQCMLEEFVPNAAVVLRCFLSGTYYYRKSGLPVKALRDFLSCLISLSDEKKRIVLANVRAKLDAAPRYRMPEDDDIPF